MNKLGAIQIIRDTLGGGGVQRKVSPNDPRGGGGLAKVSLASWPKLHTCNYLAVFSIDDMRKMSKLRKFLCGETLTQTLLMQIIR